MEIKFFKSQHSWEKLDCTRTVGIRCCFCV